METRPCHIWSLPGDHIKTTIRQRPDTNSNKHKVTEVNIIYRETRNNNNQHQVTDRAHLQRDLTQIAISIR